MAVSYVLEKYKFALKVDCDTYRFSRFNRLYDKNQIKNRTWILKAYVKVNTAKAIKLPNYHAG